MFLFEIRIKLRFLSDLFLLILASVVEIIDMEVGSISRIVQYVLNDLEVQSTSNGAENKPPGCLRRGKLFCCKCLSSYCSIIATVV